MYQTRGAGTQHDGEKVAYRRLAVYAVLRNTRSEIGEDTVSRGGSESIATRFRRARCEDAEAIHRLSLPFMDSGNLIVRELWFFELLIDDFWVLDIDGRIVGCGGLRRFGDSGVSSGSAEIINVAVDEQWQDLGLGRVLLTGMIAVAHTEGFDQVVIFSKTTVPWFALHGFRPIDPAQLPDERVALMDPERGSVPLRRSTVGGLPATISCTS